HAQIFPMKQALFHKDFPDMKVPTEFARDPAAVERGFPLTHYEALMQVLTNLEPPVFPSLLDRLIPQPAPSNLALTSQAAAAGVAAGTLTGTVALPSLAVAGQLTAGWATSATSAFPLTSLNITRATVTDASGNTVDSGAVGLSASAPVPAA